MGKLNIAHHKSYHPYRRDNIERVRRDEEEAQLKEAREEGRITLADSEARIALLREKASGSGSSKARKREDEKRESELLDQATNADARREALTAGPSTSSLGGTGKHINLFVDLEQNAMVANLARTKAVEQVGKGKAVDESEKGVPLAPSQKDLKPWYSERASEPAERDEKERAKDLRLKSRLDPHTSIQKELAGRYPSSSSNNPSSRARTWGAPPSFKTNASRHPKSSHLSSLTSPPHQSHPGTVDPDPEAGSESRGAEGEGVGVGPDRDPQSQRTARVSRETSERARAQALRVAARKKREAALRSASATPSTVRGEEGVYSYGDQFHAREVEEAHRRRGFFERARPRDIRTDFGWDDEGPQLERERTDRERDHRRRGR